MKSQIKNKTKIYVVIGLIITAIAATYIAFKIIDLTYRPEKLSSSVIDTLINNDWQSKSLTPLTTSSYAKWLLSPAAESLNKNLSKLKSSHSYKYLKTESLNYVEKENGYRTLVLISLIKLDNVIHLVNFEFIYDNSSSKTPRLNNFYIYADNAESNEVKEFIKTMLNDLNTQHWNSTTWEKYASPDLLPLLKIINSTGISLLKKAFNPIRFTKPLTDKSIHVSLNTYRNDVTAYVQLSEIVGTANLTLIKVKGEWKIESLHRN